VGGGGSRNGTESEVSVFSRVNFLETAPDRLDDVARVVRELVHPAISEEAGYVGYIVLADGTSGKAMGVTLWESERAREASDAKARQIRPQVEQQTGGTMRAVERYEVLFIDVKP
jgi:quinol monooxygenase YgiN